MSKELDEYIAEQNRCITCLWKMAQNLSDISAHTTDNLGNKHAPSATSGGQVAITLMVHLQACRDFAIQIRDAESIEDLTEVKKAIQTVELPTEDAAPLHGFIESKQEELQSAPVARLVTG